MARVRLTALLSDVVLRIVNVSISAALVALVLVISASATAQRGSISLSASEAGVSVAGRGFQPSERVVLKAKIDTRTVKRTIRAGTTGRFTTRLDSADATCSPVSVTATGSRGTTAATRRVRIPEACGMVVQP
jgi:hypothetical protein